MEIVKIKKIEKIENCDFERYDIETETHNFFANNILVHNSNLQCSIDENGEFTFGSRSQFYAPYSDFQGSSKVFLKEKIKEKLMKMKELISNDKKVIDILNKLAGFDPEKDDLKTKFVLTVYGELCGGMYRHPDVEKVKGAIKIQGRVDYHPDNKWIPFDIVLRWPNGSTIMLMDQDEVVKYCKAVDLPYPIILFRGTLEECLKYPVDFIDTTGNILWNLPVIKENISEGIVIKPNKGMRMFNNERVIIKKKGEKFKERISKNKDHKEVLPMNDVEMKWFDLINEYITESRLMSVLSKLDVSKLNDKSFGIILGGFLKDMWKDFYKENESEVLNEVEKSPEFNFDKVRKEISKYVSKFIQPYFLKLIGKR